ncbi:hypothetical protein FA15DRAFT_676544 [Coprinopsis marcescibilis]|uniref:DNA-directed RNA polymerase I subunit RPA34 n=1 Tax=Coprinopsis marcescibilis TaxID=230819 RepID=A0A5C3KAZ9_COPMA|nr:hypothetical protein FA15DRAFT_676544 [Coprinopsis marcescibilis]
MSSGSESDSSSSPSDSVLTQKHHKSRSKISKAKGKSKTQGNGAENDAAWAFKPPADRVLLENLGNAGEFDYDAIASNDDLELWVIRVPDAVKPKHLSGLKLDPIPSSTSSKTLKLGSLKKKHATFDVWSLGESDDTDTVLVGGEELSGLSLLLPRSKKNKLYNPPKQISRRLVLAAQPVIATPPNQSDLPTFNSTTKKYQNATRPSYPHDFLTHTFKPYGSLIRGGDASQTQSTQQPIAEEDNDEEQGGHALSEKKLGSKSKAKPAKESAATEAKEKKKKQEKIKGKKRKAAPDTDADADPVEKPAPKKSKKSKGAS